MVFIVVSSPFRGVLASTDATFVEAFTRERYVWRALPFHSNSLLLKLLIII